MNLLFHSCVLLKTVEEKILKETRKKLINNKKNVEVCFMDYITNT